MTDAAAPPAATQAGTGLPLVEAVGVSKRFARFHRRATSLKERVIRREQGVKEDFWALRDISLAVHSGETVGITGPNGSGKSTLLKVLSGILQPTAGQVRVRGRVASLLELGAGFDGELTGRENVYLNSALLGVPRHETDRLFDDIVDFSELAAIIDNPVKHYSSGQYVRLGFSVAVHVDPDILIVDEVLAVGDEAFQRKCLDRIADFQRAGKTILFVSHSPGHITSLCTRAVLLDHGRMLFDGDPGHAIEELHDLLGVDDVVRKDEGVLKIREVSFVDPGTGVAPDLFRGTCGARFFAVLDWLVTEPLPAPVEVDLTFVCGGESVAVLDPDTFTLPPDEPIASGGHTVLEWDVPTLPALVGEVGLRLRARTAGRTIATAVLPGIRLVSDGIETVEGIPRVVPPTEYTHPIS